MPPKTALIIEDEIPARMRMRQLIAAHPEQITVVGEADTGKKAIELIEKLHPELLFLDIQLPDMQGFEILNHLSYSPWIIFTTAYSEYALQAFEAHSLDYLVKPIERERFAKTMEKLSHWDEKPSPDLQALQQLIGTLQQPTPAFHLPVKKKDKIILVEYAKIAFFQAEDKYVNAHLTSGTQHLLTQSLTQLQEKLPDQFIRVHRSYIVNRNYVTEIQKYFKGKFILQLADTTQTQVVSGETYTAVVKAAFGF